MGLSSSPKVADAASKSGRGKTGTVEPYEHCRYRKHKSLETETVYY